MLPLLATNVTLIAAFGGGVLSFLSPCVLPLVPAYMSVVTGLSVNDLKERRSDQLWQIGRTTGFFVLGFTVVFVGLGLTATALGDTLVQNQVLLSRISGVVILAFAAYLAGSQVLMAPGAYREVRFHPKLDRFGVFAAPVAGAAFAFGWSPCIGPLLGSVLAVAATSGRAYYGAALLAAYSLGLGLCFLAVALMLARFAAPLAWVQRHSRSITFVAAGVLALLGLLLLTNQLEAITREIERAARDLGLGWLLRL
jgi:cytochrome c-type biogenesis protein